jgi:hypothetical protein
LVILVDASQTAGSAGRSGAANDGAIAVSKHAIARSTK